ncbi:Altered inheritance of mitochondria protein 6 [Penicillium rubens]|uniref:Altered inheritance of mitochondria protein 6 n=2 Tax=Penicillium chrysogenum species complex TaxID=254878 RepID=B6H5L9_PENRW|nr:Altered inheritance of mitochondria protein 6 [Penicillium rubens]KZN89948.1 Altered inheritance of mitochondria protein 6-like protein [Penicillium chrysogenum]CAP74199.1 Pc14g00580 [Penicillium rubens Wisconsin 54-1255]
MLVSNNQTRLSFWKCSHLDCIAYPGSKRAMFCRAVQRPLWALIFIIGILTVAWQCFLYLFPCELELVNFPSERSSSSSDWSTYGVIPIPCHSHNDYWRHVPLRSALRAGCISFEVDVWPWGNEILVGHSASTVLRGTLQSLYLDPLLKMLDTHNEPPSRNWPKVMGQEMVGLFSNDPKQSLTLLVDCKTEGGRTWPLLVERLNPFREKGYLTHFNGSDVVYGPITVVASGDAPLHLLLENTTYRDVFYDAPLDNLTFPAEITADDYKSMDSTYNPSNSYYASADFRTAIGSLSLSRLSNVQLAILRSQVRAAHKLGLKVRYWGTPTWPVGLRNHVWHVLVHEGVDVVNTDDLRGATRQDWKPHHWWQWWV